MASVGSPWDPLCGKPFTRHGCWISLMMLTGAVEPSVRWSDVSRHSPSTSTHAWPFGLDSRGCRPRHREDDVQVVLAQRRRMRFEIGVGAPAISDQCPDHRLWIGGFVMRNAGHPECHLRNAAKRRLSLIVTRFDLGAGLPGGDRVTHLSTPGQRQADADRRGGDP
jgi:hypothetical protein